MDTIDDGRPWMKTERELLIAIYEKTEKIMATVESVTAVATQLKDDLEAFITAAQAEFAKLEGEITPADLTPLQELLQGLDNNVKGVTIPTE